MKRFLTTGLAIALTSIVAQAETAKEWSDKGDAAFAQREYSNAGANSAQQAADFYAKAVEAATDNTTKAQAYIDLAKALYFVGDVSRANEVKIEKHSQGIEAADKALKLLGLANPGTVTDAELVQLKKSLAGKPELLLVGEGLYQRGTNLGQWGQANGVVQSLSKWGELRRSMESIELLGLLAKIHDYGAYRVLGRGYFKIPSLLGGDQAKALKYLSTAFNQSKNKDQGFSRNGYNNLYYAEVLAENGNADKAKEILQAFISAEPENIDKTSVPEIKEAQRLSKELLKQL